MASAAGATGNLGKIISQWPKGEKTFAGFVSDSQFGNSSGPVSLIIEGGVGAGDLALTTASDLADLSLGAPKNLVSPLRAAVNKLITANIQQVELRGTKSLVIRSGFLGCGAAVLKPGAVIDCSDIRAITDDTKRVQAFLRALDAVAKQPKPAVTAPHTREKPRSAVKPQAASVFSVYCERFWDEIKKQDSERLEKTYVYLDRGLEGIKLNDSLSSVLEKVKTSLMVKDVGGRDRLLKDMITEVSKKGSAAHLVCVINLGGCDIQYGKERDVIRQLQRLNREEGITYISFSNGSIDMGRGSGAVATLFCCCYGPRVLRFESSMTLAKSNADIPVAPTRDLQNNTFGTMREAFVRRLFQDNLLKLGDAVTTVNPLPVERSRRRGLSGEIERGADGLNVVVDVRPESEMKL